MDLQRIPASGQSEQNERMLDALATDGGVVAEGIFPASVITALRDSLVEAAASHAPGTATQGLGEAGKAFTGSNTIRFSSLGRISPAYFELLDNPTYATLADAVLLPSCGSYWVNTGQAMFIGPGESAQMLHRDCDNWARYCATGWPAVADVTISAMIALVEVTEELGATRVIPGSHKWEDYRDRGNASMTVPAELTPGDALIYSGKVLHGGGANMSAHTWRRAVHLSFLVGWLVPEESSALDYAPGELDAYSPRVQRLLGHRSYDPRPHFGGGLWLRHVRKIEDAAESPPSQPYRGNSV